MSAEHSVIVVPGLGDNRKGSNLLTDFSTRHWRRHGLEPIIHRVGWHDHESFEPKLQRLLDLINQEADKGKKVSLVGLSAGGSAVLNTFSEMPDKINGVVSVASRLRSGGFGPRSLESRGAKSPAFVESVKRFEKHEDKLTDADKLKVMTMRALIDELVPDETAKLKGAHNVHIPMFEHGASIYSALTLFSKPLIDFLKNGPPNKK